LEVKPELTELSEWVVRLGLKLGADEVAAISNHSVARQVRFANNQVTITNTWDEVEVSILLKKAGRVLVSSTTDISKEALEDAVRNLVKAANVVKRHESYAPLPEGPFQYGEVPGIYDGEVARLGEEAVDYVEAAVNAALEAGARRVAGTLTSMESASSLATSKNVSASIRRTAMSLMVRGLADGEASGMGVTCGATLRDFHPEEAGRDAGRLAGMSTKVAPVEAGKHATILGRPAAAVFFDILAGMSSAFHVDSGVSCLVGKLGRKVASEALSVYDDPRRPGGLGSTPFDDEGYPTRRTPIIEGGVLRNYLHNSLTAKRHGVRSTANAGWIAPHAWNVVVSEGEIADDELVEEVKDGLFVNNMTYVRFQDYRSGDFSTIIRDGVFRIKNGEIVGAVRGLRLSDNVLHMLEGVNALSREARQVSHWWMEWGSPSVWTPLVLIREVNYTKPTK